MNTLDGYIAGRLTPYSTQLAACAGLVEETQAIMAVYKKGMTTSQLYDAVYYSGVLRYLSESRLKVVVRAFAQRYADDGGDMLIDLREWAGAVSGRVLNQMLHIHTARTNPVYHDFVTQVYWKDYRKDCDGISINSAKDFLDEAHFDKRIKKGWAETTSKAVASSLLECCADFDLIYKDSAFIKGFRNPVIEKVVALYLAYYLHFSGVGDNSIVSHHLWGVFGLDTAGVHDLLNRLAREGWLIYQAAGPVVSISWTLKDHDVVLEAVRLGA